MRCRAPPGRDDAPIFLDECSFKTRIRVAEAHRSRLRVATSGESRGPRKTLPRQPIPAKSDEARRLRPDLQLAECEAHSKIPRGRVGSHPVFPPEAFATGVGVKLLLSLARQFTARFDGDASVF